MSRFGPLISSEDVRLALESHLVTWTPAYIAEIGRQRGETLAAFRGFGVSSEDTYPVCLTAVAGTTGDPARHGDGTVSAGFPAVAASLVAAPTRERATALAGWYGLAVRAAVLQHRDLSGFASDTEWLVESFQEVAFTTSLAIMACYQRFVVYVDGVVDVNGGPAVPPVNPATDPGDFPQVETVVGQIVRDPTV